MITIGRNSKNDIVLADASVAEEHACIEAIEGNRLVIIDRGTHSGTFLWRNDRWIQVLRAHLGPQDRIRFGNREMDWHELSGSSAGSGLGIPAAAGKRQAGLFLKGKMSEKPIFENPKRNPFTGAVEERDAES